MKHKLGNKLLALLMMLVLAVGLVPGMGLKVWAAEYAGTVSASMLAVNDIVKKNCTITVNNAFLMVYEGSDSNGTELHGTDNVGLGATPPAQDSYTVTKDYKVSDTDYVSQTGDYIICLTPAAVDPTYSAPTEQTLTYTGSEQTLVDTGSVSAGGTMEYAISNSSSSAPASGWSTTAPSGISAGTYYIWWRINETDGYNAVAASCLTSTIEKKRSRTYMD